MRMLENTKDEFGIAEDEYKNVVEAPREGDGGMHQSTDKGCMHLFLDAKKLHGKGTHKQTDKQTDIATTRSNWPSGPI